MTYIKWGRMSTDRITRYIPLARAVWTRSMEFHEAIASALGLHATDIKALRLLGEGPLTVGRIAEGLELTGPSATALVDRLETAGYARRERSTVDRRQVTIVADGKKLDALNALYEPYQADMRKVLDAYGEGEFEAILAYLSQTERLLKAHTGLLADRHDASDEPHF